jgi:two-component system response regulator HydG
MQLQARPSDPLIGVIVDSGQLARLAVGSGADFLLALSVAAFRQQGVTPLAAYLPFHHSNESAWELTFRQIAPVAGSTPIVVGLMPSDPLVAVEERLRQLQANGIAGVTNYPSVTTIDGSLRTIFEREGWTVESELAMLEQAKRLGLGTLAFVPTEPALARRFAALAPDALIITPGLTHELDDVIEHGGRVEQAIRQLNAAAEAAREVSAETICLAFGGPITAAADFELLLRHGQFAGLVGGSIFSRLPIEKSVSAAIRQFKSVRLASRDAGLGPLVGSSAVMQQLYRQIERAADYELNVCLEGESGSGKELVATQIHRGSRRQHAPLVTLNCGAIPDTLLESELFGHEKGAFTGAERRRLGKFELANGGTLFLDEVGDLSPHGQVALLRAIQQREITRVGGERPLEVDCRILCATNQPLAELVQRGRFRADLYYRLNQLTIRVPALRERPDDLPLLARPILAALRVQIGREYTGLSPGFLARLKRHRWPGNVRELQHVIYQAAFLEDGPVLEGREFVPVEAEPGGAPMPSRDRRQQALAAVQQAGGNKASAAIALGVSRKTLYQWLRAERE